MEAEEKNRTGVFTDFSYDLFVSVCLKALHTFRFAYSNTVSLVQNTFDMPKLSLNALNAPFFKSKFIMCIYFRCFAKDFAWKIRHKSLQHTIRCVDGIVTGCCTCIYSHTSVNGRSRDKYFT